MKIGVIGGAGVAATNKLCEIIETKFTQNGAYRDEHHPEMIIYQATKVPSRSMFLEGRGESFIEEYVEIGKKLKQIGARKLCLCCNTAHYALPILIKEIDIPFINVIEEVVLAAKKTGKLKFGLVASNGCLLGKVYEKQFENIFPEAQIIYPDIEFQTLVTKGICNIKNTHRFDLEDSSERPNTIFSHVYQHLLNKGAEIIIMGCTDIRVDYFNPKQTIDSLEILASSIINLTKDEK